MAARRKASQAFEVLVDGKHMSFFLRYSVVRFSSSKFSTLSPLRLVEIVNDDIKPSVFLNDIVRLTQISNLFVELRYLFEAQRAERYFMVASLISIFCS